MDGYTWYTDNEIKTIKSMLKADKSLAEITKKLETKHSPYGLSYKITDIINENPREFNKELIKKYREEARRLYSPSYISRFGLSDDEVYKILLRNFYGIPKSELAKKNKISVSAIDLFKSVKKSEKVDCLWSNDYRFSMENIINNAIKIYAQTPDNAIKREIKEKVFKKFIDRLAKETSELDLSKIDYCLKLWYEIKYKPKRKIMIKETELADKIHEIVNKTFNMSIKDDLKYNDIKEEIKKTLLLYYSSYNPDFKFWADESLKNLNEKEHLLIDMIYGIEGYKQHRTSKIQSKFSVTRQAINLAKKAIIQKMRKYLVNREII